MVGNTRVIGARPSMWRLTLLGGVALALVTNGLVVAATPANAEVLPKPPVVDAQVLPKPPVVDAQVLTPAQLAEQIKAAEALRADRQPG